MSLLIIRTAPSSLTANRNVSLHIIFSWKQEPRKLFFLKWKHIWRNRRAEQREQTQSRDSFTSKEKLAEFETMSINPTELFDLLSSPTSSLFPSVLPPKQIAEATPFSQLLFIYASFFQSRTELKQTCREGLMQEDFIKASLLEQQRAATQSLTSMRRE